MTKRACVLAALVIMMFLVPGCAKKDPEPGTVSEPAAATPSPAVPESEMFSTAEHLIGLVIKKDDKISTYTLEHGFLRTAENLGYAAQLFSFDSTQSAEDAVRSAIEAGCEGLIVYDPGSIYQKAIALASENDIRVVVPYYKSTASGVDSNVIADDHEYLEEVARSVAERMKERNLKTGRLLVYGQNTNYSYAEFVKAIGQYYPEYSVTEFTRTQQDRQAAIDELAGFILNNRDIKGLFCTDDDGAAIAVKAREKAQKDLKGIKSTPTPKPTPTPSASPGPNSATPVPEALLKNIIITVIGTGITNENVQLLENNDIYAVVSAPYYESAAQSTMLLDKLMRGSSVPASQTLNIPIVRQDTMQKYLAVYNQVLDWFDLEEGQ
jgi:ABC-type sugar transport system substrate-binding protein